MGQRQRRCPAGVGYRHDHVDVVIVSGKAFENPFCKGLPHPQPGFVDGYAVHDGIRSCEVYVFKNTGCEFRFAGAHAGVQLAVVADEDCFARCHVAYQLETQYIERDAFRGNHEFVPLVGLSTAENQRPDPVDIPECNNATTDYHRDSRIGSLAASMHAFHRGEYMISLR